ncbi:histidinol-phosphatase [Agrobacterium rhizogenes]|uniref:histidinol-phosphatase n=1 Tax=Rhizobium rhizogenes TaxID=359 RepID=UPI00115D3FFD|nr:histidinol-phosphatase [Rhizobium rhizogenes]NTG90992.1 histidinol-phosphatase [Rhizobium rhizogenes]NTI20265.1 histidinol-phosphatase [Rhizobium rhizogenes]NTI39313.1 histidinol-phosphatase [Rhizobium rhizogenes]TRB19717.1 histidinol-phosphatase HisJ family protein [Rhizobium rhizogenes]WEO68969.1 histidinol-phosphatase [Rhizobium rhizogenes]
MVWFSYHGGHSGEFCAHATSTLEEVVDTAIERGFTHYGLSEHCPRYRAQDLYPGEEKLGIAGLAAAFEAYVARALDLRDARAGEIELFVGFETETLPPEGWLQAMMTVRDAYPFDYIVGSVHDICGRWVDFSPADTAVLTADLGGPEALQVAYFDAVTNMVESLRPDIVAHLDLVRKYEPAGFSFSARALRAIETTLEAIGTSGGVLDVNCAAFRNEYGPVYPLPQILERARAMGIRVTFGDDSHGAQTVGVGLDQSLAAIAAAGYETVAYLTRADGWREAALDTLRPRRG